MKRYCLVLEGGGVKCAYQNGALEVLEKCGYKFDAICGTSFGALNAAMYIDGKNAKLNAFWDNLSGGQMFHEPRLDKIMDDVYHGNSILTKENIGFLVEGIKDGNSLIDQITNDYYALIKANVNEEAIRKSDCALYITTCKVADSKNKIINIIKTILNPVEIVLDCFKTNYPNNFLELTDMTPLELAKDDIPEGKLPEFICASASIPPFKRIEIDGTKYYDGGAYQNLPLEMAKKRGFKDLVVIRTNPGVVEEDNPNVLLIAPTKSFGSCALFSKDNIADMKKQGFMDAVALMDKIKGNNLLWKLKKKKLLKNK